MAKVVWTKRALHDLEEIGDYISKDSVKYAKFTLEKLVDSASLIGKHPILGRLVPEAKDKAIWEIIKGNYRVIYQIRRDNAVFILTVFHTSRLLTKKDIE